MLNKAEIQASSFDRLRMRWSDFSGLDLMVSLSNHGRIVFQSLHRIRLIASRFIPETLQRLSGIVTNASAFCDPG